MKTSTNSKLAKVATFGKVALASGAAYVALASAGCNAILGNDYATLDAGAALSIDGSFGAGNLLVLAPDASDSDANGVVVGASGDDQMDSGALFADGSSAPPTLPGDSGSGAATCGANETMCSGTCAKTSDPLFGCGAASCTPCDIPRGTAACNGGKCILAACDPGYADCNQDPSDGCETDLSLPAHCGACNATCAAAAPNCAPVGANFECTTGCSGKSPTLCGSQCVDLTSSSNHCGSCSNACAAVANGKTSCASSTCEVTCDNGFHACGSSCASSSAVTSCGTSCTACPIPANAIPRCASGTCGFVCLPGYRDCDMNAANGCEAMLVNGACPVSPPPMDAGTGSAPDASAPMDASTD